jgi:hypothetical protein
VRRSSLAIAVALTAAPSLARAHGPDPPRNVLAVGPSLGDVNKPSAGGGVWFIVNVGGGYTFSTKEGPEHLAAPHFFIGAPLPLNLFWDNDRPWYFEPYYRPTYARDGAVHEVGVLFKGAVVLRE